MDNVILIGMPGCGKSSVGQLLAKQLGRPLADTDEMIEQGQGRTISEIFAAEGELFFRDLESQAAQAAAQLHGTVISTGGGMILRPENMEVLGKAGTIFFLDRPPEDIVGANLSDRPLIGENREKVFALYETRIDLYRRYAHYIVENRISPQHCVTEILRLLKEGANV